MANAVKAYYLVCFDISGDKERQRAGKLLLRHGQRVQESVFEIALAGPHELEGLKKRLISILEEENEMRFYRLCLDCRKASHRIDGMPLAGFPAVVII